MADREFVKIKPPLALNVDGEPEAARLRWMIGARDRMLKVASIGVFYEDSKITIALPLLETSEGDAYLNVKVAAEAVGVAAGVALNKVMNREMRRRRAEAKRVAKRATVPEQLRILRKAWERTQKCEALGEGELAEAQREAARQDLARLMAEIP